MKKVWVLILFLLVSCSKKETQEADLLGDIENVPTESLAIAPSNLKYFVKNHVLTIGDSIGSHTPVHQGSKGNFLISPGLPAGLIFNETTGNISGSATIEQVEREYLVSVTNDAGFATTKVNITIKQVPPSNLEYNQNSVSITKGDNFPELYPVSLDGGLVSSASISPSLPLGLFFDADSGLIYGSPVNTQDAVEYTVTVSNSGGSTSLGILIEVKGRAPEALRYSSPSPSQLAGIEIDQNVPFYGGDLATTFEVSPSLPDGLVLDPVSGVIQGNSSQVVSSQNYQITASNQWGSTSSSISLTIRPNVSSISTGLGHTCAIKNKKVLCWGLNDYQQLGYASSSSCDVGGGVLKDCSKVPAFVLDVSSEQIKALKVVNSLTSTCALTAEAKVLCWGDNSLGQLGTNSLSPTSLTPLFVKDSGGVEDIVGIVDIVAGSNHFCAQNVQGNLLCWGDNSLGQLGTFISTFSRVAINILDYNNQVISGISSVGGGYNHNCYIKQGITRCFGDNNLYVFGNGNNFSDFNLDPLIDINDDVVLGGLKVIAGESYGVVLNNEGKLKSFGFNSFGEIADGSTSIRSKAVSTLVSSSEVLKNISGLFSGKNSWCYLKDSIGYCSGLNDSNMGQVSSSGQYVYPVPILQTDNVPLSDLTLISEGFSSHRCTAQEGLLYCFGSNQGGQLGNGTTLDSALPTMVSLP